MKRLEERITCQDAAGQRYEVEVYREVARMEDGSQELGPREALIAGDPPRPVTAFDGEDTFRTRGGQILRRVREPDLREANGTDQG